MTDKRFPVAAVAAQAAPRATWSNYPEPFASRMARREKRPLGDQFGLENFGVNLTRLVPGGVICHKAACVPGSQPRPGSIIARSTAHRPETRRNRAHFAARTRRNFLLSFCEIKYNREVQGNGSAVDDQPLSRK